MSEQSGISDHQASQDAPDPHPFGPPSSIFSPLPLQRQSNQMAKVGLVLAFLVWPVGLVLSIMALFRAGKRGGAGMFTGVWGVLVSVALAIATLAVLTGSPAAVYDPGCDSAKSAISGINGVLNADLGKLDSAGGTSGEQGELTQMVNALQPLQNDLGQADALATHQSVENAIQNADVDAQAFILALQSEQSGDDNNGIALQMTQRSGDLNADAGYIDQVCAG